MNLNFGGRSKSHYVRLNIQPEYKAINIFLKTYLISLIYIFISLNFVNFNQVLLQIKFNLIISIRLCLNSIN